jgi:hypothetical protein
VNYLTIGSGLTKACKASGRNVKLAFYQRLLYEDGVLTLPLVIEEEDQRAAVFVYAEADASAAAHYSGTRELLQQRERINAYYYALDPLLPADPAAVVEPLDTTHFDRPERERPGAEYAIWWPTPEEPRWVDSPALGHLDRWFEALDGYSYLLFTSFVKELNLAESDENQLFALPAQPMMVQVDGPGELMLYLHASKAEGMWLAFHTSDTSAAERNLLLKLLADLATRIRALIEERGIEPSTEELGCALGSWHEVREQATRMESEEAEDMRIGCIVESGTTRWRMPGATSAADRKASAASAEQSEALGEFVGQQLDFALEVIGKATENGEAEDSEPNLHPFIAVQKGGDVYRTTLHYCSEQEVMEACPMIVAVRGDVERIAVVWDGFLRQGEERTDAVLARAQAKGEAQCHLYGQRYRPPEGGRPAAPLGNPVIFATGPSLFPESPESEGEPPPPSQSLHAFVEQTVDATLKWITLGDPSGVKLYHEGMALFSPNMHLKVGDETRLHRFALGNLVWAVKASRKTVSEESQARLAVLVYDDVMTLNGRDARSLRFHAHEPGAPRSWVFAQAYETPQADEPFTTKGPLTLVGYAEPLFPAGS